MLLEVPISSGADAFIWGVAIVLALVVAIMTVDIFKETKTDNSDKAEK